MDIKQLYYFTAVAQAGSYSKAAESLAVSQPTLSVTVKKLEEELGVQLFYAFNREQHLTDEGLRLWTKAKQILDLYQETLDDMKTTNKNICICNVLTVCVYDWDACIFCCCNCCKTDSCVTTCWFDDR